MRGGGRGRGNDEFQPPVILPVPEDRHSISNTGDAVVQPYLLLLPHTHPTSVCLECLLSAFPVLTSSSDSFPCYSVRHQTQAPPAKAFRQPGNSSAPAVPDPSPSEICVYSLFNWAGTPRKHSEFLFYTGRGLPKYLWSI